MRIEFQTSTGTVAALEDVDAFLEFVGANLPGALRLEVGSETKSTASISRRPERSELVEMLLWQDEGMPSPTDLYLAGDCEVLAVALQEVVPTGRLIAAFDPVPAHGGRRTRGAPYLIHAGLLVDDMVHDLEGCTPKASWLSNWFDNGNASEHASWDLVDRRELERMQRRRMSEADLERARPYARMIALATGLVVPNALDPSPPSLR